jgi:RHS repeat-associated protein
MVLTDNGAGATVIKEALMYQPYGAVSDVDGIPAARLEPLRQKFTTKEFDEDGQLDVGLIEFNIALDFALTHSDPNKPNRVAVYYTDAPANPEIVNITIDPTTNYGKVNAVLKNATSRTIASIQFKLNDDAVTCNVENIAEITNPGSKLIIEKIFTNISEFLSTVPKTFLNYSNASFYMAGIGAYHFGFRVYDPETGVWMSTDPADQFWNTYSYCGGDPVNYTDPDGASVPGIVFALAGAAIGGYVGGVAGNGGEMNPAKWENQQSWMIGATAGFAIGGGLGYGIESGALALTDVSLLSNANYAGLSGAAAGQIASITVASGNSGVDATTQAAPTIADYEPTFEERLHAELQREIERYRNDPLDFMPTGGGIRIVGNTYKLAKIVRLSKAINLPSWRKITIDMTHVLSGHVKGGLRVSSKKDLFPTNMSITEIEQSIRQAYRYGKKILTQGERVLMQGEANGLKIEMWVNKATKTIETAYPIGF